MHRRTSTRHLCPEAIDPVTALRWDRSLRSFLESTEHPLVRAYAIATFVVSLPEDLTGLSSLRNSYAGDFFRSYREVDPMRLDPKILARIEHAKTQLHHPTAGNTITKRNVTPDRPPVHQETSCSVLIPLVLEIPSGHSGGTEYLAMVSRFWICIYCRETGHAPIDTGVQPGGVTRSTRLDHVARTSYAGAIASLRRSRRFQWPTLLKHTRSSLGFAITDIGIQGEVFGRSEGLGLAAVFLRAMLAERNHRWCQRPREDLVWTGGCEANGQILAVEPETLKIKARAAYYSGSAGMVVPQSQIGVVQGTIAKARRESRSRAVDRPSPFEIHGVGHLTDLLKRDDLLEMPSRLPNGPRRLTTLLWTWTIFVAAVLTASLYLTNLPGPRVLRPIESVLLVTRTGLHLPVIHLAEGTVSSLAVQNRLESLPERASNQAIYLIVGYLPDAASAGRISVSDCSGFWPFGAKEVWRYQFSSSHLPYEPLDEIPEAIGYNPISISAGDLNGNGRDELLVATSAHPFYPTVLWYFGQSTKPEGQVVVPGHLEQNWTILCDLDGDGREEVAAGGTHNPANGVALLLLRREHFRVDRPEWSLDRQPCLAHLVVPNHPDLDQINPGFLSLLDPLVAWRKERSLIQITLSALGDGLPQSDYVLTFQPPDRVVGLSANATLVHYSRSSGQDLCSSAFLDDWVGRFRLSRYIIWTWPPIPESVLATYSPVKNEP